MMWRKKIEIRVSKLLMQTAMTDASATVIREELTRQTREQLYGTWLQGARTPWTTDSPNTQQQSSQNGPRYPTATT